MGPKSYAQTGTTERSTSIPEMKIDRRVGLPFLAPLKHGRWVRGLDASGLGRFVTFHLKLVSISLLHQKFMR
jgi:hypothetical protein